MISPALLASPESLEAADPEALRRAQAEIVAALGPGYSPAPEEDGRPSLRVVHPAGVELVAVPGGAFDMGLSDRDIAEVADHVDLTSRLAARLRALCAAARPVHRVAIGPFLCAIRLFGDTGASLLTRDDSLALAASLGLRLVSEAELEWLARDGGVTPFTLDAARRREEIDHDDGRLASRFGVRGIHELTWAADEWHASYDGAPSDGRAWLEGDPCGVQRGGFWLRAMQSEEELLEALAAVRRRGRDRARLRLARDLTELAAHAGT